MRRLRYLPLLIMALAVTAAAEDDGTGSMGAETQTKVDQILARPEIRLDDLFRLADLANPDLAAARLEIEARTGQMKQFGLYPNPEITFAVEEMFVDDPDVRKQKVELSQALLIGGRRGAAVGAARTQVDQAGELALATRRQSLGRVHKWWAHQIYFREAGAAFDEIQAETEKTLQIAQARFEAKAAPEAHVTRAMLEVYELEVARQEFERDLARNTAEMKVLFGGIEISAERLAGTLDPEAESACPPTDAEAVMGGHPSLRAARLGVEAAEAMVRTAKKERIPDLEIFVGYGSARPDFGNFVEGGISLPLPLFQRNQGRVAETTSQAAMARLRERMAVQELEMALSTARLNHATAHHQLDQLTEQISPAAERALAQAQEAYRAGRLMFLELVDAQRTFNTVHLRTMELRRDLALAEADLMSLLGEGPYADKGEVR